MRSLPFRRWHAPLVFLVMGALIAGSISARPQPGAALRARVAGSWAAGWAAGGPAVATPVRWPAPPTPADAFDLLQRRAAAPLDVHWSPLSGVADFLSGAGPAGRLPYTPTAAEIGDPLAIARGFLDENRALFGLGSVAADLRLSRVEPDPQLDFTHVRMAQVYHGIPVFGRQLVVHLDPQARVVAVNGQLAPALDLPDQPSLRKDLAERVALRDLLEEQLQPAERARAITRVLGEKTSLAIYVDPRGKATLSWLVTIMTDTPLGQWRYFVNARRPVVVHRFDSADTGKQRRTYTADNSTEVPGRLLIEEGERSRDKIAQAAHDAAGKVYDYYFTTFKRDGVDGRGSAMVSTVHYGSDPEDAENAAWIGEAAQMVYGDGGRIFKPLAYGLDVVGHEFTHGVIDNTAQLVYEGQSGALNESYADVFGALIDRGNWTIGEQVVKSPPFPLPYMRDMQDPTAGGNYDRSDPLNAIGQPGTMRDYANLPLSRRADNGGVHINSGIPNHAAYLVAQAVGIDKMEKIYYRAMTQYLTPEDDFLAAARATVRAATDLYSATEAGVVRGAFAQVGLSVDGSTSTPQPPASTPTLPQRGPTTPPPTKSLPAGCTDVVTSGGFESDDGWVQVAPKTNAGLIDTELPHTGARSAWLGGTDEEAVQYIYQEVRIPANATTVQLSYYRLLHSETTGLLGLFSAEAKFNALIANTKGDVIGTIEKLTSSQGDNSWRLVRADLAQFAGKTVRLMFTAENPRRNVSSLFVDDVSLAVCTTGAAPGAPAPPSEDQVFVRGTITNADTGRGVEGAQVFILNPELSASEAAADDTVQGNEVLTQGVTDADGLYQSEAAIPRGQTYSAIVIAPGYRAIVADDGIEVPSDASSPFQVDATLRRGR